MNPRRSALPVRPLLRRRAAPAPRFGIASAVLAISVGLAGCTSAPAPKPTPTPLFASKAEAFKAAEQVYRDYTDASNERRDGTGGLDPQSFLAGQALEDDINAQRTFDEKHLKVIGPNRVASFHPVGYEEKRSQVEAELCIDVTSSHVRNDSGVDVTPSTRASEVALHVVMTGEGDHLVITSAVAGTHSCLL